jgi:hypothetical protein
VNSRTARDHQGRASARGTCDRLALNVAHQTLTPADIYRGRRKRATGAVAELLEIPCGPNCLGARFNALWTARGLILAPQLPTLVDLLFQPSLNGLSAVPHMAAHPVADGAIALIPPAIQGVNGDAQHFRDIRK